MRRVVIDNIGKEIGGRYRILARLGEGGMGTVYRAEQISLKRRVAVKVLKSDLSADPALVRRFNAEAELAAKLNHPNTVTLYDFGQDDDGSLFIAMEFVEGESLREVMLREGPMPVPRTIEICAQVCASISDAHSNGIVHRDLKPDNVMLTERGKRRDVVRVLDFGIAKLRDAKGDVTAMPMTQAGDLLGTPQYMAPEQIRGEKVDARTDVYAMGAMIYELVTGRLPFEAPTLMAILSKHLTEMPVPPNDRRADLSIPPALSALVMNALAKKPDDRPASMDLFADRLREIGESLSGPSLATAPPVANPYGHGPAVATSGMPSVVSPPPGVPRRLSTPVPHLTPQPAAGQMPRAPIEHSLAQADSVARAGLAGTPAPMQQPAPMLPPMQQPAPMQQPPMQPLMTPGSPQRLNSRPAPRSSSNGLIWAVLAFLLLAGVGAAAFFALKKSDKKDKDSAAPEKKDDEDKEGDEKGSEVPSLHDWDLNSSSRLEDDVDHGDPEADDAELAVWTHPDLPVAIDYPKDFSHQFSDPMHTLTGRLGGHDIVIYVFAVMVDAPATIKMQKEALKALVQTGGAVIVRDGQQVIAGRKRYTATYEARGAEKGQAVAYVKDKLLVLVGFSTSPTHFSHTNRVRKAFFQEHVALL